MLDSIPSKGSLVSIEGVSSTLSCVISLDLRVASVVKKQSDDNCENEHTCWLGVHPPTPSKQAAASTETKEASLPKA